jgi:DNA-binding CsgD family transcriptional regulator
MDVPDLTKIRIVVSHGSVLQVKEALEVLEKVEDSLSNVYNSYHLVDIELLKAIALLRVGNEKRAQGSLEKALLLAEKKGMIRPILEVNRAMPSIFSLIKTTDISYRILVRLGLNTSAVKLPAPSGTAVESLTPREQEIVKLVANGLRNKEVAGLLHISTVTVKSHMTNVYRKLNVSNRTSMLRVIRRETILS